ncbi:MAG: hypothetical protein FJ164_04040 [Gammaproteobacteria bacterium]|nr:hypothetical protein [Gammaproteobacteria bacterium]
MYHYTDGGLRNVWLRNGFEIHDTDYGKAVAFVDGDGLIRAICLALACKASRLTGGEFRYLRASGLLMTQPALGKLLGVDGQTVARWEKSGRVPRWAEKLVRLLYVAHADGDEPIRAVLARMGGDEQTAAQSIILETTRKGWRVASSKLSNAA